MYRVRVIDIIISPGTMYGKYFLAPRVAFVCNHVKLINVCCFINLKPLTRIHIYFGEPSGAC